MSTISVVLIVVAIVGLVVVAMAVQSLITTLRSLRTTVEDLREETMSAVAELRATVALANGDEIHAKVVVSSVDPNLTFLKFMNERDLPGDFVESVKRYKYRGSSGKVNLALDALPNFTCLPGAGPHLRGAISISPSIDYMERAYDDAKYGQFSSRPYMDMVIPSLTDPSVAPPGKHVMSCFVQYAPYHLKDGVWDDRQREAFGDAVVDFSVHHARLEHQAFSDAVTDWEKQRYFEQI